MNKRSPNRIDKYVGSKIRVRRHTLGISQRKLAHALGLSFQQIQRYENRTDRIGGRTLAAAVPSSPGLCSLFLSRCSEHIGWLLTRT